MRVEQLVYTSCPRGLGAGPGFQAQAVSPGLSPDDRAELERVPLLRRPADLGADASDAQVASVCPPGIFGRRLASGRLAVTRRVYVGKDYSGRPGNSVLHSLVFDPAPSFPLAELSAWTGWVGVASDEPPKLATLGKEDFDLRGGDDPLRAFLATDPQRPARLAVLLDKLLADQAAPFPMGVAVRAEPDAVAMWVASALAVLPGNCEPPVSFITFADDLMPKADVRGVTASAPGNLAQAGVAIVDSDGRGPAFPPASRTAQTLARLLCSDRGALADWRTFCRSFRMPPSFPAVAGLVDAWDFARGNALPPDQAEFVRMIDSVGRYLIAGAAIPDGFVNAVRQLNSVQLRQRGGNAAALPLTHLCRQAGDARLTEATRGSVGRLSIATIIEAGPWREIADAADVLDPSPATARARAVDSALADGLAGEVAHSPAAMVAALDFVLSDGNGAPGSPPAGAWNGNRVARLAQGAAVAGAAPEVLEVVFQRALAQPAPQAVADLCRRLMTPAADYQPPAPVLGEALGKSLGGKLISPQANQVRSALIALQLNELVYHEVRSRLPGASADDALKVLDSLIGDGRDPTLCRHFADPLNEMVHSCDGAGKLKLAQWLLDRDDWFGVLGAAEADAVLAAIDGSVKLDPADRRSAELAARIRRIAGNGADRFPRVRLRGIADDPGTFGEKGWAAQLRKATAEATPALAGEFVLAALPGLIGRCETFADLREIVAAAFDIVPPATAQAVGAALKQPLSQAALSALVLGAGLAANDNAYTKPTTPRLPQPVEKVLVPAVRKELARLSQARWNELRASIRQRLPKAADVRAGWLYLQEESELRRQSTLQKVIRVLGGPIRLIRGRSS